MPAVCSVCYHTFKHKYGLDQVETRFFQTLSMFSKGKLYQEDELSEVRLCGALAEELGQVHGRGRWTITIIITRPKPAYGR